MRRSSSISNIPRLKCEGRKRSQSSTRGSNVTDSAAKRTGRTVSTDRLTVPKRSNSFVGNSKKSLVTPSRGMVTPLSCRSRSRSPFRTNSAMKSERHININDKRWVNEQYVKIRRFLLDQNNEFEDHMPDIKPPTINTFIHVTDLLFKQIDPQLTIASGTYKEKVLATLKKIQYPGNVSNSLLKTVNTMHAWPQVISMWSWLVDLITYIQNHGLSATTPLQNQQKNQIIECILEFLCNRYIIYNRDDGEPTKVNEEFLNKFKNILNIDTSKIVRMQEDVDDLAAKKEKQLLTLTERQNRNELLEKEKNRLQHEIDTFYEVVDQKQREQDDLLSQLKERKTKLEESIKNREKNNLHLKEVIKKQSCTFEEKNKMLVRIEQLKHSNNLKKELIETRKRIICDCDFRLEEARKQLETEVYRLNSEVLKLKVHDPSLSVLELRTAGFLGIAFKEEFEDFVKTINHISKQNHDAIKESKTLIQERKSKINALQRQLEGVKTKTSKLTDEEKSVESQIEKYHQDIENVQKNTVLELEMYSQKIKDLESSVPAVNATKLELRDAIKNCQNIHEQCEKLQLMVLDFVQNFYENTMDSLMAKKEIKSNLDNLIAETYANVLKELDSVYKNLMLLEDITCEK